MSTIGSPPLDVPPPIENLDDLEFDIDFDGWIRHHRINDSQHTPDPLINENTSADTDASDVSGSTLVQEAPVESQLEEPDRDSEFIDYYTLFATFTHLAPPIGEGAAFNAVMNSADKATTTPDINPLGVSNVFGMGPLPPVTNPELGGPLLSSVFLDPLPEPANPEPQPQVISQAFLDSVSDMDSLDHSLHPDVMRPVRSAAFLDPARMHLLADDAATVITEGEPNVNTAAAENRKKRKSQNGQRVRGRSIPGRGDANSISAYAQLEFEDAIFHLTTHSLVIGRDDTTMKLAKKLQHELLSNPGNEEVAASVRAQRSDYTESYVSEQGGFLGPAIAKQMMRRRRRPQGVSQAGSSNGEGPSSRPASEADVDAADGRKDVEIIEVGSREYVEHTPGSAAIRDVLSFMPKEDVDAFLGIHSPGSLDEVIKRTRGISRKHVEISYNAETGEFQAKALHSNGFFLNDEMIKMGPPRTLRTGDWLQIKDVNFRFNISHVAQGRTGGVDEPPEITETEAGAAPHKSRNGRRSQATGGKEISFDFERNNDASPHARDTSEDDDPLDISKTTGGNTTGGNAAAPRRKSSGQRGPNVLDAQMVQGALQTLPLPDGGMPSVRAGTILAASGAPAATTTTTNTDEAAEAAAAAEMEEQLAGIAEIMQPFRESNEEGLPKKRGPGRPPKNGLFSIREMKARIEAGGLAPEQETLLQKAIQSMRHKHKKSKDRQPDKRAQEAAAAAAAAQAAQQQQALAQQPLAQQPLAQAVANNGHAELMAGQQQQLQQLQQLQQFVQVHDAQQQQTQTAADHQRRAHADDGMHDLQLLQEAVNQQAISEYMTAVANNPELDSDQTTANALLAALGQVSGSGQVQGQDQQQHDFASLINGTAHANAETANGSGDAGGDARAMLLDLPTGFDMVPGTPDGSLDGQAYANAAYGTQLSTPGAGGVAGGYGTPSGTPGATPGQDGLTPVKRKVGRPRKHPLENGEERPEKRKYKQRKPRIGEDGSVLDDEAGRAMDVDGAGSLSGTEGTSTPAPKRAERHKTPPLVLNAADYTPAQLAKPNKNYSVLIDEVLTEAMPHGLHLKQIYKRIQAKYPYYYFAVETKGWESSVRHNLIGNDAFRKNDASVWHRVPGVELDAGKKRKAHSPEQPNGPAFQNYNAQWQQGQQVQQQGGFFPQPAMQASAMLQQQQMQQQMGQQMGQGQMQAQQAQQVQQAQQAQAQQAQAQQAQAQQAQAQTFPTAQHAPGSMAPPPQPQAQLPPRPAANAQQPAQPVLYPSIEHDEPRNPAFAQTTPRVQQLPLPAVPRPAGPQPQQQPQQQRMQPTPGATPAAPVQRPASTQVPGRSTSNTPAPASTAGPSTATPAKAASPAASASSASDLKPAVSPELTRLIRLFKAQVMRQAGSLGDNVEKTAMGVVNRGLGFTKTTSTENAQLDGILYGVFLQAKMQVPESAAFDPALLAKLVAFKETFQSLISGKMGDMAEALVLSAIDRVLEFTDQSMMQPATDAEKREIEGAENLIMQEASKVVHAHRVAQKGAATASAATPPAGTPAEPPATPAPTPAQAPAQAPAPTTTTPVQTPAHTPAPPPVQAPTTSAVPTVLAATAVQAVPAAVASTSTPAAAPVQAPVAAAAPSPASVTPAVTPAVTPVFQAPAAPVAPAQPAPPVPTAPAPPSTPATPVIDAPAALAAPAAEAVPTASATQAPQPSTDALTPAPPAPLAPSV